MTIYSELAFYLSGPALIVMFAWIASAFYMAHFQLELLRTYFKNSPATLGKIASKRDPVSLKMTSISMITNHVAFHKHHTRKGDVSAEDILNMPAHFRKKCVVLTWMQLGSLTVVMLIGAPQAIMDLIEKF